MYKTELISFAWSSSLKISSAFWGLTIHKHSLSPSQSKLNTSEKSAWASLGTRSWTGHMRATRVLWRGCWAGVWLTHGLDHPDGGCKTSLSTLNFSWGFVLLGFGTSPFCWLNSPHQWLSQYFSPSCCMCLFWDCHGLGIHLQMSCCLPRVCHCSVVTSRKNCLKTFIIIMIIMAVIAAHSQEKKQEFSHTGIPDKPAANIFYFI